MTKIRYLVTEEMNESWHSNYLYEEYKDERGLQTAYIYLCSSDDEQRFGSLQCVWDDMVYILCDQDGAWLEQADTGRVITVVTFHGSGMRIYCAFRENMIQV